MIETKIILRLRFLIAFLLLGIKDATNKQKTTQLIQLCHKE